jgi:hypothetical protein
MIDNLGPNAVHAIQDKIEPLAAQYHPNLDRVLPAEVANTAEENLPLFKRYYLLEPVRRGPPVVADVYYGDYTSSSPDVFVLPRNPLVLCTLSPGRTVFLSDEVTHHFSMVDGVDYKKQIVTLLDPWAPVSFLLPGNNVVDVRARAYTGPRGQPLLDLTFDEFLRVIHGSLEMAEPVPYFETLEKLSPKMADNDDYLFWKYSRRLASGDFETGLFADLEVKRRSDLASRPKLRLLLDYSNDLTIGVITSFTIPRPGTGAARKEDVSGLRSAFRQRLGAYSTALPWSLKWLLLARTDETTDTELRLEIVDSFLKADPSDVDFQIVRAETLLRQNRVADALSQLDMAQRQWTADVTKMIATSPDEKALDFFFAKDYGVHSLRVLHWRYARIQLLRVIGQLMQNPQTDESGSVDDLAKKYVAGPLDIDFFPELLQIFWLSHATADEEAELVAILPYANDAARRTHIAKAFYQQFMARQSITTVSGPARARLRQSAVGAELCGILRDGRIIPNISASYQSDLKAFCQ